MCSCFGLCFYFSDDKAQNKKNYMIPPKSKFSHHYQSSSALNQYQTLPIVENDEQSSLSNQTQTQWNNIHTNSNQTGSSYRDNAIILTSPLSDLSKIQSFINGEYITIAQSVRWKNNLNQCLTSRALKYPHNNKLNKILIENNPQLDYDKWKIFKNDSNDCENNLIKQTDLVIIYHELTGRNLSVEDNRIVCRENRNSKINISDYWRLKFEADELYNNSYVQIIHVQTQKILNVVGDNNKKYCLALSDRCTQKSQWQIQICNN